MVGSPFTLCLPMEKTFARPLSRGSLKLTAAFIGRDLLLALSGGDAPHVGAAALAFPAEGEAGGGTLCQSLAAPGHRDDIPARELAERLSRETGARVLCACGIHFDGASPELIAEILEASRGLGDEAAAWATENAPRQNEKP